jgi:hypothetical protein
LVSERCESDETGSMFRLLSLNRSCAGEPTMADPIELSRNVSPFTVLPNAMEVLERLLDSYKGLSERDSLSAVDRAVLAVVEMTLKQVAEAV